MYQSFVLKTTNEKGIVNFPAWDVIQRNFTKGNNNITHFYRINPTAIRSDHLLVKLIESINVPYPTNSNLEVYASAVRDKAYSLASSLRISSASYKGSIGHNGYFFGKACDEIIIANNEPFSISDAIADWQNIQPIKVLYHEMTSLLPPLLDGKRNYQSGGYSVISINIPLLAVQYQMWRAKVQSGLIYKLDTAHFVKSYPIANMIFSYQDLAVFNRIDRLSRNLEISKYSSNYHSFALIDDTFDANRVLSQVLSKVESAPYSFNRILTTIPAVTANNALGTLVMPDLPDTRQIYWSLVLARLPAISFLLRISKDNPANSQIKNDWRVALRELHYDNSFSGVMSRLDISKLWQYINANIAPYV